MLAVLVRIVGMLPFSFSSIRMWLHLPSVRGLVECLDLSTDTGGFVCLFCRVGDGALGTWALFAFRPCAILKCACSVPMLFPQVTAPLVLLVSAIGPGGLSG